MENNRFREEQNNTNESNNNSEQHVIDPVVMHVIVDFQVNEIFKESQRQEFIKNMNA